MTEIAVPSMATDPRAVTDLSRLRIPNALVLAVLGIRASEQALIRRLRGPGGV